jgi:hypothetical protein
MPITYETTTEHQIDRLEVSVEIDDVQDVSYLDEERNGGGINDPDPEIRMGARADAIRKARHGKSWGNVCVIVRSQPDDVIRASLSGIDALASSAYRNYPRDSVLYSPAVEERAEHAAAYFGEILSELVDEARAEIATETGWVADARTLPVVDQMNGSVDGADVREMASTAVDWWVCP